MAIGIHTHACFDDIDLEKIWKARSSCLNDMRKKKESRFTWTDRWRVLTLVSIVVDISKLGQTHAEPCMMTSQHFTLCIPHIPTQYHSVVSSAVNLKSEINLTRCSPNLTSLSKCWGAWDTTCCWSEIRNRTCCSPNVSSPSKSLGGQECWGAWDTACCQSEIRFFTCCSPNLSNLSKSLGGPEVLRDLKHHLLLIWNQKPHTLQPHSHRLSLKGSRVLRSLRHYQLLIWHRIPS